MELLPTPTVSTYAVARITRPHAGSPCPGRRYAQQWSNTVPARSPGDRPTRPRMRLSRVEKGLLIDLYA